MECSNNKSCDSDSNGGTTSNSNSGASSNNRDLYLKHLNKISHKISKPRNRELHAPLNTAEILPQQQQPVYHNKNPHAPEHLQPRQQQQTVYNNTPDYNIKSHAPEILLPQQQHQHDFNKSHAPQNLPQQQQQLDYNANMPHAPHAPDILQQQPQRPVSDSNFRKPAVFDTHAPQQNTAEVAVSLQPQPQQQPPVYNINKSDFRDVVQKLTGSPAHERVPAAPPLAPPQKAATASSRLQRIRPPPLAQITNRPPPQPSPLYGFSGGQFSPLPPFPAVNTAAESPISAYMRFLQSSISSSSSSALAPPFPPQFPLQQNIPPPPFAAVIPPSSPLPFGCLPSPKSPYGLLSPSGQLGFQQLPLSPTVPSPKWKGI